MFTPIASWAGDDAGLPAPVAAACSVPDAVAWGDAPRLISTKRVGQAQEIRIVVLGSSSTAGVGASQIRNSFVRRLGAALSANTSLRHRFRVVNAGVSGETTADMLRRLRRDVLEAHPSVVVWQTGVNDAIKGVPLKLFSRDLANGLAEMRSRAIPVVLIDQQALPQGKSRDFDKYVSEMQNVAGQEQVTLLHRYRVMRYLSDRRSGGLKSLLASDGLHMNDDAHRCIGDLLAAGIVRIFG